VASGRATKISAAQVAGEDQHPEQDEESDLRDPAEPLVEGDDAALRRDGRRAERQRGQVDGEQAGAVGDLGDPVGERRRGDRRHRVDSVRGQLDPGDHPDRRPAQDHPDDDPDGDLQRDQADHVRGAVTGLLDPFDEADHQQQRDRVVHPRLALERTCQAFLQGRVAQHGEDRGRVGGGDRGADDHPFQPGQPEDPFRRRAREERRRQRPQGGERGRRAEHRADLRPARREAALEEDQDQRDRPQRPRQVVVGEVDLADPFGARQHPEAEEEQQGGDPHAVGEQGTDDPGGQQDAGDQDQDGVVVAHGGTLVRGPASCCGYTFSSITASRASSSSGEPGAGVSSGWSVWGRRYTQ
jgi:hypothetical protein